MKDKEVKGVFYFIDKEGCINDISGEMLDVEDEITSELVRLGIVSDMRIKAPDKNS